MASPMFASLAQFRRAPGYSLAFVLSLAIGIAATCTSFAVAKRAFLDPLPYPDPDRLVTIRTVVEGEASIGSSYRFGEDLRGSLNSQLDILRQRQASQREAREKIAFLDAELTRIEEQVEDRIGDVLEDPPPLIIQPAVRQAE